MTKSARSPHGASPEAIQHHYDASNEFFRLWLDETMTYSAAMWSDGDDGDTLEAAQLRKLDHHAEQARVGGAHRVLDVGCGWGSGMRRMVEAHEVESAVGLTLSAAQAAWIREFDDPRLDVRRESWADHEPAGPYDAIVSIGAFEHFARPEFSEDEKAHVYRTFFSRCHSLLGAGRWMSLQTIAWGNAGPEDRVDFIVREIFPESDLPRLREIADAADRLFEVVSLRNDRHHYARTLKVWLERLRSRRDEALALVGEEKVATFEHYLRLCARAFDSGAVHLHRIAFRRIDRPRQKP